MYFDNVDTSRAYKCERCGGKVYKAKQGDKTYYVHMTANNYAEHKPNCPKRPPDIKN